MSRPVLTIASRQAKCQKPYCRGKAKFKPWSHEIEKTYCYTHAQEVREKEADAIALEKGINDALNI